MKYKTYLPIFNGFYNTIWEPNLENVEYDIKNQREENGLFSEIDYNDIDFNNMQYEIDVIQSLCNIIQNEMSDFINNIEFQKINSPKEYNFKNDSADVSIDVNIDKIKEYIYSNKEAFSKFLKERYTSCDGFMSHYNNDFVSWESDTSNFTDFSIDGHRLGSILDFIAINEDITEYTLYESIEVYAESYINNFDELCNQQDGSLLEFLIVNGYNQEYAEYLSTTFENGNIDKLLLDTKTERLLKEYQVNINNLKN